MKVAALLQLISITTLCVILIRSIAEMKKSSELYEGVSYDWGRQLVLNVTYIGNEAMQKGKRAKRIKVHDQLKLAKGTYYYLGNSFFNLFYPNYIKVKKSYFPKPFELLIGVKDDEIEISVLKGEIETNFSRERYRANNKRWILIRKRDYFECNGYRFQIE